MDIQKPMSQKIALLSHLKESIQTRISEAEVAIAATRESRDSDTKSTAGDKHEVGRAMIQIELDNQQAQLQKNLQLKEELARISLDRKYEEVAHGSLVITDAGTYFISIGMGQVTHEDVLYFVISLASPIGALLNHKVVGDSISFNGRSIVIEAIV